MTDEKVEVLKVDSATVDSPHWEPPKQSANSLFRFFEKSDFLFETIEKSALIPRYYPETVDYLNIKMHHIAYPMICFCDINLHRIDEHISLYGGYGIAFSKVWGIEKGIQPMHYVNPRSFLCNDFSLAFNASIKSDTEDAAQNYLLSQMYYLKPLTGTMLRNEKEISRIFTDECEWRYIPNVLVESLPQAVTDKEQFSINKSLNPTLASKDSCWLKFTYEDVKHIILQKDEDFKAFCTLLDNHTISIETKKKLISKVIIWNDSKGDF